MLDLREEIQNEIIEKIKLLTPESVATSLQILVEREISLFNKLGPDELEMIEITKHNVIVLAHACARFEMQAEHEKSQIQSELTESEKSD